MVNKYTPFLNIGPGEFIKEELETRNWRQEDLADIIGISLKSVNKLIMNKQAITIETAKLLSKAFGQSPQYWINLDTNYRLRLQKEGLEEKDVEIRANIYRYMPVKEMIKKGWLKSFKTIDDLVNEIKKFWGISTLDFSFIDDDVSINFRKSETFTQYNKYYAYAWFKMAQRCARLFKVKKYNRDTLRVLAADLFRYTESENGVETFLKELNKSGVKFFVLSHIQKTYIDGASFFDSSNPVIVYTARHNRTDNFWFTLAHEIAHVLLHLKKQDDRFIDNLDDLNTEKEKAANKFAEGILKAKEILRYFDPYRKYISMERVLSCAHELEISPAIVVGILQHNDFLSQRNLNRFKTPVLELISTEFFPERDVEKITEVA